MIQITDRKNCCGCAACVQRCPKQCITLYEDNEGFLYPKADADVCIDCGVCEMVCPVINQGESRKPLKVFAAINPNEGIRAVSSSGGIFTLLAEKVTGDGGIVFGARYNTDWEVVHAYSETVDGLSAFRGSKYVQSRIGNTFRDTERFLKAGKKVLFSGTPCQIAGLRRFLRREYESLITVDVACHGVPSPKVWKEYLSSVCKLSEILHITMRDKSDSWRKYRLTIKGKETIISECASTNKYILGFLQNLSLRPSCYQCPAKGGKSGSDITLADYWGIEKLCPDMDDDKGTSFVCTNTLKGCMLFESVSTKKEIMNYNDSIVFNPCMEHNIPEPKTRISFWEAYQTSGINALYALKASQTNILKRVIRRFIKTSL